MDMDIEMVEDMCRSVQNPGATTPVPAHAVSMNRPQDAHDELRAVANSSSKQRTCRWRQTQDDQMDQQVSSRSHRHGSQAVRRVGRKGKGMRVVKGEVERALPR